MYIRLDPEEKCKDITHQTKTMHEGENNLIHAQQPAVFSPNDLLCGTRNNK